MTFFVGHSQDVSLPADLRQHTLTQYNASLFNPTFSLDRNNPQSVAFWTRWQWQNVDADPTTLFLNYTRSLDDNSAAGAGFFQHNTGIYFNTGATLNYAYQIKFNRLIKLSFGANLFGFKQEIADTRFPVNPIPGIPQSAPTDDFILQLAPGFNLSVENFSMSLASENLFDYNFTDKGANTATSDKIFMGMASYDFPVMASDSTAYIRPSIYLRTIPEQDNQIGMNALLSVQKYWAQVGYNNFYGISVGAGGTVYNRFSLGALVEFGTSGSLNSKDPSFEIVASYFLGKPEDRRKLVVSGIDEMDQEVVLENPELTIEQMREELKKAEEAANGVAASEEKTDEVDEIESDARNEEDKTTEALDKKELKKLANEQKAIEKQQRKDSIAVVKQEKAALALQEKLEEEKSIIAEKKLKDAQKEAALVETEKAKIAEEALEDAKKAAALSEAEKVKEQKRLSDLKNEEDTKALAQAESLKKQRTLDAINAAKKADALAQAAAIAEERKIADQRKQDSIVKLQKAAEVASTQKAVEETKKAAEEEVVTEEVTRQAGEKYEEVATEDGLEPGFYLIANVFGTKKYFDAFMGDLGKKGMQPKSFFRSKNKYNYAYLERYDSIGEARRARDGNFGGKYSGKTWIFRVVGK